MTYFFSYNPLEHSAKNFSIPLLCFSILFSHWICRMRRERINRKVSEFILPEDVERILISDRQKREIA